MDSQATVIVEVHDLTPLGAERIAELVKRAIKIGIDSLMADKDMVDRFDISLRPEFVVKKKHYHMPGD